MLRDPCRHDLGFKKLVVQKLVDEGAELNLNTLAVLKKALRRGAQPALKHASR